ncbi:murein biosynthesis integral membrane protein MurJ [Rhizosaccharibacter radicis]|uniref:Probable lipid II flippase MurJ n=1 Tax=Rhizosaccharibacter radicis TaxID=2782605 RepID=A0ABT1VY77_9PROT|nr:murein biosynthesis integral membrane protein MurJ [Acetobacteraceae bacterium KSS12]
MLRGFLTVGGWTMASRVLGLVRDQLLAATLGVGPVQDAYQVAFRLPNLFRRLFGEGAFNSAFVPLFSGLLAREGAEVARGFAREALGVLLFWLLILTVAGEIFMPQVIGVIGYGFAPATKAIAISLSRITFPYVLLICAAALVSGVLNGLERFGVAAAAYVLFNVVGIGAILFLTPFVAGVAHAAAWGITLSGVAQLAVLMLAARRAGMGLGLPRPRLTPRMRLLMRRMLPGLVGSGVTQLNLGIDTIIGTLLPPGSVSLMYFADRVNQLPLGVLGAAAGTTMLPVLARQAQTGDEEAARRTQNSAIEYGLILTLPSALALMVLAAPILSTLFGYGHFTAHDAVLSGQSLAAYALGLPFFVLVKVLTPGFFARGDTSTPVRIGMATLALNLTLNLMLMRPLHHVGPPLASSLAAAANAAVLAFLLFRRGYLRPDRRMLSRLARMGAAAAIMAAAVGTAQRMLLPDIAQLAGLHRLALLGTLILAGMTAYALALQAMGVIRLSTVRDAVARRLKRRRSARI